MAMPAITCPALQRRPSQSVDTTFVGLSPNGDESGKQSLYPNGNPDRHQNLISCSWPIVNLPENFISIRSIVLRKVANRQTDKQSNRQTGKQRRKHILLGGGKINKKIIVNINIFAFCCQKR